MSVSKLPYCAIEISITGAVYQVFYNYPRYTLSGKRFEHRSLGVFGRFRTLREVMEQVRALTQAGKITADADIQLKVDDDVVILRSDADWALALLSETQE